MSTTTEGAKADSGGVIEALPIPPVLDRITLWGKTGVVIDEEAWEDFVQDLMSAARFQEARREEAEGALIPYAEVKKRMWGNYIKDVRRAKGLTQKQLAERLDVKQSYISKIEKPDYRPWASTLEKVAKALGCEIEELI
ncbi:helix-turn-helix domain-containing protein [Nitrospinae bacterium AH_259_B05_G02_I21]|nr:helix-turn-helix domain-containing protein [Nitrospinae bacterium AH_259_B05_G02_I21]